VRQVFLPVLQFSPVIIIPQMFHTHLHLHVTLSRRTKRQSLRICQKAMLFWKSGRGPFVRKMYKCIYKYKYINLKRISTKRERKSVTCCTFLYDVHNVKTAGCPCSFVCLSVRIFHAKTASRVRRDLILESGCGCDDYDDGKNKAKQPPTALICSNAMSLS
jgi:hypothetical protein